MKLNRRTTGAVILFILILLLFFSKTIYTYNMPEVTGTKPRRGSLSKMEITSGIASWAETENIYAVSAGSVERVYIKEGEYVEKDQILFEMDFDVPTTERRLAEINNNISKLEADTRLLQSRLNNIKEALAAATKDKNIVETNSKLSGQSGLIVLEINKAKTLVNNTQFAFEIGIQSRNELINAENNLQTLFYKYESEADELQHNILSKRMDIDNLRLSRETISEILKDYRNNSIVKAPASGIVHELYAERGKFFTENALLVSIGVGDEFIVECSISLDNNFVNIGDNCELSNANHTLEGTVRRIKPSVNGKTVTIALSSEGVNGETFEITFEKITETSFILVPNGCVNQDNNGYFVYQIKRRKGFLGQEYYLERLNIFTGDSEHQNTVVIRGITFFEPVVLASNKILSDGQTILLKNQEDFFEN